MILLTTLIPNTPFKITIQVMSENGFLLFLVSQKPSEKSSLSTWISKNRSPAYLEDHARTRIRGENKHDEFFFGPLKDGATFPFPNGINKRLVDT